MEKLNLIKKQKNWVGDGMERDQSERCREGETRAEQLDKISNLDTQKADRGPSCEGKKKAERQEEDEEAGRGVGC